MQEADDLILVGIGSILNERRLKPLYSCGKRVVIFGRLGLPEAAITNSATLLAGAPGLRLEQQETDEILFILQVTVL